MGIWGDIKGAASNLNPYTALTGLGSAIKEKRGSEYADIDPTGRYGDAAGRAGAFAGRGEQDYGSAMAGMGDTEDMYRRRATGEDSYSAEALRQGLQQQQSQQMSMARGGAPGGSAMRMRQAMQNAGRAGTAMSGQQAMAGIKEREGAMAGLGGLQQARAGLGAQVGLGGRGQQIGAYGDMEGARTQRYGADMGVPTTGEKLFGAIGGAAQVAALSDRRAKTDIRTGDVAAEALMSGLQTRRDQMGESRRSVNMEQRRDDMLRDRARIVGDRNSPNQAGPSVQGLAAARRLTGNYPDRDDPRAVEARRGLSARTGEVEKMMDALKAYKYKYKDPGRHGEGERVGVMAQDLEKSRMGRTQTYADADGTKGIQLDSSALAAGLANLNDRLNKMEGGK